MLVSGCASSVLELTSSSSLKIQLHAMFIDTSFNNIKTVLSNLYQCFVESARKCYHYIKSLPKKKYPRVQLLISKLATRKASRRFSKKISNIVRMTETVDDLIMLSISMMQGKQRKTTSLLYQCAVTRAQARW